MEAQGGGTVLGLRLGRVHRVELYLQRELPDDRQFIAHAFASILDGLGAGRLGTDAGLSPILS